MQKTQSKKNLLLYVVTSLLLLAFLTMLFVTLFSSNANGSVLCYDDEYRGILAEVYPNLQWEKGKGNNELRFVEKGQSIVTYSYLAQQLVEANGDYMFYPQSKETVVIAIDRNATSESVGSFTELFASSHEISFFLGDKVALGVWGEQSSRIYTSLCLGLYNNYDIKKLASELDKLNESGRFFANQYKPFMVMTDKQAVDLKKNGENIEIILPSDGTHTFVRGVLTSKSVESNNAQLTAKLVENGYRTVDNQADSSYYPTNESYGVAKEVTDIVSYSSAVANAGKVIRRDVFDVKRFGFATNPDRGIMFVVLSALIVVYMTLLNNRVKQDNVRIAIKLTCLAEIGLMASYILRMMLTTSESAYTLIWYLYYVFFGVLSMAFLYISLKVGVTKGNGKRERVKNVIYSIYVAITSLCLLFTMTNNLHNQVFYIISTSAGIERYTYQWGYYLIAVVIYIPVLFSIALMIYKAHKSPRKFAMLYPCLAVLALLVYGVLYALEVPIARDFDIAFATTLFSLLILESCFRTGLVPINVGYNKLFSQSKLKMQIVSSQGHLTSGTNVLDDSNTEKIVNAIPSGEFVYYKDIKEINAIKKQLADTIDKLQLNNQKLIKENQIKEELTKTLALSNTLKQINQIITRDKETIEQLLEQMKTADNRADFIARINLLATGIKRKSMLKIDSIAGQKLEHSIVGSIVDEVRQFTKGTKLKFSSICRLTQSVTTNQLLLELYSIYLKTIDNALASNAQMVFVQCYQNDDSLVLSLTADKQLLTTAEIAQLTASSGVKISQSMWEGNDVVLLSVAKGAE